MERYDLVVIGSGPAGEKGAAQAAYFGRRGALVERTPHVGGAGVNTGTVPSTTLRETALYFSGLRQRGLYGVAYGVKTDLTVQDFMDREQEVVKALREVVRANVERHAIDPVEVLLEVNVSGEQSKFGLAPSDVDQFMDTASTKAPKVRCAGLMTMPPFTDDPERARPCFAALRDLAQRLRRDWEPQHSFKTLSMGTSQDYEVAVEEGATIVRLGAVLYE